MRAAKREERRGPDPGRLQPTHVLLNLLPINGSPVHFSMGSRTRSTAHLCRHLPASLVGSSNSLVREDPSEVCSLSRRGMFHPVSAPLQPGIGLLRRPLPASLSAFLAVGFPLSRRDTGLPCSIETTTMR